MLESGVAAVFGPCDDGSGDVMALEEQAACVAGRVRRLSAAAHVPHLDCSTRPPTPAAHVPHASFTLDFAPSSRLLARLYADVVRHFAWPIVLVLYDTDIGTAPEDRLTCEFRLFEKLYLGTL